MKKTEEQLLRENERKWKLDVKLRQLNSLITGRNNSIFPYTRTETGEHSEEKTMNFISKLMTISESKLSQEEREFYESFLYCNIRAIADGPWWMSESVSTFENILEMARTAHFDGTEEELIEQEKFYRVDNFFGYMDEMYHLITGNEIVLLTEKERELKEKKDRLDGEAKEEYYREHPEEKKESVLSKEDLEAVLESQAEEMERLIAESKQWAENFANPESFCEQYKKYRKLYFIYYRRSDFEENIESMLNNFLEKEGLVIYGDDETFYDVYTIIRRSVNRISHTIKEGR